MHRHSQNRHGHHVVVARSPDLTLELDDAGEFVQRGEIPIGDIAHREAVRVPLSEFEQVNSESEQWVIVFNAIAV